MSMLSGWPHGLGDHTPAAVVLAATVFLEAVMVVRICAGVRRVGAPPAFERPDHRCAHLPAPWCALCLAVVRLLALVDAGLTPDQARVRQFQRERDRGCRRW